MGYYIYPLVFHTPVHFGSAELGGDLSTCGVEYSSDTLIGAILHELSVYGDDNLLNAVRDKLSQQKIMFSDLFPYTKSDNGEYKLYLPKPVLMGKRKAISKDLQEVRRMATELKKQKKMSYIQAANMGKFMKSLMEGGNFIDGVSFYDMAVTERVNMRGEQPLPYFVGSCSFRENSGMYVIVYAETDEDADLISKILSYLLAGGIGGKRSSGYGKAVIGEPVAENNDDWQAILSMLRNNEKGWQMSLSSLIPNVEEIEMVQQGYYKLKQRSGFISTFGDESVKKSSVSVLSSGACFPKRIAGSKVVLAEGNARAVERYGTALFVGLENYE